MREGWTYKKFEDCLVKAPKAKQVQTSQYNTGTKYPIVSQEDALISGYFDDDAYLYHIDNPIVVFGDHTRVLKYIDFDFVVGADGVKILIPKEFLNAKLLYYYLLWYKIPNLGYSRHYKLLKEIDIPIPPLSEQQSIVAELDKINELISLKKAQLSDLDSLAQSIFYDMFGDPIENGKEWEVKKLGEICNIGTGATPSRIQENRYYGGNIPNGYNAKLEEDTYKSEGIMYFRCQNVWRNRFDYSDLVYIDEETNKKMKSSSLKHNDFLITKIGRINTENSSLGRISLYEGEDNKANLSGNLCFARLKDNIANHKFILYILISNRFRDYIRRTTVGGIDKRALNVKQISSFPIILPPLSLQQEFAKRIELIEQQKAQISSTIKDLETLLASRMQYWFD